jgi:regulator of sirC expression with transglutaminase-like and TPR domain
VADDPTARFAALVERPDDIPLDEACLLVAAHAIPDLDPDVTLGALDRLAALVEEPTVDALCTTLFGAEHFTGDRTSYNDPRNSLLPEVLERRTGIPITLAVVAMEVGRRCGVDLVGVGMPGHFVVRPAGDATRFVDVFDGGARLGVDGCRAIFERLHPSATWSVEYLAPVDDRMILTRILANLAGAYRRLGDRPSLLWALGLRQHLPGVTDRDRRELAVLMGASGRFAEAAAALELVGEERDLEAAGRLRARLN